ncbi:MAG TPA: lysylphosphatidylglycerol synthase transmembrane domain-containing protein [Steroidobacteraceae bacterium]|nr:lysylphosphatidylglycerol synthase transmembrane domain-containing protein [Steroidobacteraceae bacterium]
MNAAGGDLVEPHGARHWLPWLVGIAFVIAVTWGALHFSEAEEIAALAQRANPEWFWVAVALQLATYAAQSEVWRAIGNAAKFKLHFATLFRLSLAKLFLDQALPSAGLSGAAGTAKELDDIGMPMPGVMASVVLNVAGYFFAYAILLMLALAILPITTVSLRVVGVAAVLFIAISIAISVSLIWLVGRPQKKIPSGMRALKPVRELFASIEGADRSLVRSRKLIAHSTACQGAIVLLDAATVWTLLIALGTQLHPLVVFAGFMFANMFRTFGVLPGGLGTFEAGAVWMLESAGASLPAALSATLLFRGLSFWLPMLPGAWCAKDLGRHTAQKGV